MVDLFEEVEEELRTEQYKRLARRALPWVLGLVIGVVVIGGAYVGYTLWRQNQTGEAAIAYDEALRMLEQGDSEGAFNAFGEAAGQAPATYEALALMQQAGIRLGQRNNQEAANLFDQAAEAAPNSEAGLILADNARLKAAWALFPEATYEQLEARLQPLTQDDRPFRFSARDALARAKVRAGNLAEARADFLLLSTALDAPPRITQEAGGFVALIDSGDASAVTEVANAAAALPPPAGPMELPPEILEQLQQQMGAQAQ